MSVYYNLFKQNNTMILEDPVKFSEVAYQPILKNQGDYLVGVKRFKIPSQGIDRFRLYPNRYYLGMTFPASTQGSGFRNANTVAFDLTNNGDLNNFAGMPYDAEQQENYIPINSNQRLCNILNRTISQSFLGRFNQGISEPGNVPRFQVSVAAKTIAPSAPNVAVSLASPAAATAGTTYACGNIAGDVYLGFEFLLASIDNVVENLTVPTSTPLSNLCIAMTVPSVSSSTTSVDVSYIPLFENVGNNVYVGDFNTIFPFGICICSYGKTSISELQLLDKNKPFSQRLYVSPAGNEDLTHMLAQYRTAFTSNPLVTAAGGNSMGPSIDIRIANKDNTPPAPLALTFDMTYEFNVYCDDPETFGKRSDIDTPDATNPIGKAPTFGITSNTPCPTGLPTFTTEDDKLTLALPNWMFYEKSAGLYLSNGLVGLTNFSGINTNGLTDAADYNQGSIDIMSKIGLAGFPTTRQYPSTPAEFGTFLNGADLTKNANTLPYTYLSESSSSNYKRSFLWGLQIRSNNLSTSGEFVSGGRSFQKVLTDFVIDPSTNQGDYLLFEPESGGQRFYPLNASGELRQLDVSVYIVDMNNNTSVLNLPANTSLSLKVEFRPKNMVYNYIDNSTMS